MEITSNERMALNSAVGRLISGVSEDDMPQWREDAQIVVDTGRHIESVARVQYIGMTESRERGPSKRGFAAGIGDAEIPDDGELKRTENRVGAHYERIGYYRIKHDERICTVQFVHWKTSGMFADGDGHSFAIAYDRTSGRAHSFMRVAKVEATPKWRDRIFLGYLYVHGWCRILFGLLRMGIFPRQIVVRLTFNQILYEVIRSDRVPERVGDSLSYEEVQALTGA